MVLDFLNDIFPILFIPIGLLALIMGVNRAIRKEEDESKVLQWLAGIGGIGLLAVVVIVSINRYDTGDNTLITPYTILFGIFLGMSLIARPFKKLPIAFVISVIVALGALYLVSANQDTIEYFDFLSLRIILLGIVILVFLIFLISFVQEKALDTLLWIIGWGPVIIILGLVVTLQGITLLLGWPGPGGILEYLPG